MGKEQAVQDSRGFTLIELMVALAVLTILMAMAAPAFNDFFQRYRLRGAADDVVSLVASARAEAVSRNRDVAIVFSDPGTAWCVGAAAVDDPVTLGDAIDGDPSCTCADDCEVGGKVMESNGANYRGVSMGAAPASFVFSGLTGAVQPLPTTAATSLTTFSSPDTKYVLQLRVSPLGRVSLCVPSTSTKKMAGFKSC